MAFPNRINFFLLASTLIFSLISPAQDSTISPLNKKQKKEQLIRNLCEYRNNQPQDERRTKFPLNKTSYVYLVSFEGDSIPVLRGTPDFSRLLEAVPLTMAQADTVMDLLYNYGSVQAQTRTGSLDCGRPRNAIVFAEWGGRMITAVEICFRCHDWKASKEGLPLTQCDKKFDMLLEYFSSRGLKYGTTPAPSKWKLPGTR